MAYIKLLLFNESTQESNICEKDFIEEYVIEWAELTKLSDEVFIIEYKLKYWDWSSRFNSSLLAEPESCDPSNNRPSQAPYLIHWNVNNNPVYCKIDSWNEHLVLRCGWTLEFNMVLSLEQHDHY
ncbi:9021_t:CDS:1 [Paraglomus occultum]|uniref:9021_t:CDS:1 n=1 Tax=Paraglomus occultum TaxID=144539 RepID=A0A9N9A498_9GLOM|nr:9021_t:CDS:1 [Paraglomus occultum]